MLTVPGVAGRGQLDGDGGDAVILMNKGTELEVLYAKDGTLQDLESIANPETECVLQLIMVFTPIVAREWTYMAKYCKGVSAGTATGVLRLKRRVALPRH